MTTFRLDISPKKWTVPYYTRSIKYKITLLYSGYNDKTQWELPELLPISLTDKNDTGPHEDTKIIATFPNMERSVFTGIHELAEHFKSHVTDFESVDEIN